MGAGHERPRAKLSGHCDGLSRPRPERKATRSEAVWDRMVNDVVRLMDHLGIKKVALVGYSMGGSIAMKILTVHPDRIRVAIIGGSLGFTKYESEHEEV